MAEITKNREKRFIFIVLSKLRIAYGLGFVKGATKLYFTHYSCVIIILFNTDLCRSTFSVISFRKLVFRLSVLSVFFVSSQMF